MDDTEDMTPPAGRVAAEVPASFAAGRYQVLGVLGEGGQKAVYRVHDRSLDRDCALSILRHPGVGAAELQRIAEEARAIARLGTHANVVTVFDLGDENGQPYLISELLTGGDLRALLEASGGHLGMPRALAIAREVVRGLAFAHASGLVHRDLKPANVWLAADGTCKLGDFGLSVTAERARAGGFAVAGTAAYLAPEQALGDRIDHRADLYAFGCLLHELVTGSPPFRAPTTTAVIDKHLHAPPPRASAKNPEVSPALDALILSLLAKEPEGRPRSAEEVDAELGRVSAGAPALRPPTRYAQSGSVSIAYQVVGDGPIDLVFVMGWVSHLEHFWEEPHFAAFLTRLASFARLILFDKRGTGLSDRVPMNELPTLEQRMDDVRAVMDAVGSQRAVLCGVSEGGPLCALFAATHPQRTRALVMIGTYAKRIRDDDYPWAPTPEERQRFFEEIERDWGGPVGIAARAPSLAHDPAFRAWWASYLRMGASPGAALALTRMNAEIDVRALLPSIRVPTLVLHRTADRCIRVEEGRYIAQRIPGARLVELPGADHLPFVGDAGAMLAAIERFVADVDRGAAADRRLATLLGVTGAPPGVAEIVGHFRGRGLAAGLWAFDGPARAIHCARALRELSPGLRVAIHTGELVGEGGDAVEVCRATLAEVEPDAIWVTGAVRDLVAGAGLLFRPLAPRGEWRLYAVT